MKHRQYGLTLVELVVTMAVAITLIGVGVPLFTGVVENNRATAQTNGLVAALQLARGEAVKRGVVARVCADDPDDPGQCGDAAEDWENGWFVHLDLNGDGDVDAADGEMLRRWDAVTQDIDITVTGQVIVAYQGNGGLETAANPPRFEIAQPGATNVSPRRCVIVSPVGGISMQREQPQNDAPPLPNAEWSCPP